MAHQDIDEEHYEIQPNHLALLAQTCNDVKSEGQTFTEVLSHKQAPCISTTKSLTPLTTVNTEQSETTKQFSNSTAYRPICCNIANFHNGNAPQSHQPQLPTIQPDSTLNNITSDVQSAEYIRSLQSTVKEHNHDPFSIQITLPPKTTPDDLSKILRIAVETANQYKATGATGQVVVSGQVTNAQEVDMSLQEVVTKMVSKTTPSSDSSKKIGLKDVFFIGKTKSSSSVTNRNYGSAMKRIPCDCPNCLRIGRRKPNEAVGPRIHVCHYKDCGKQYSKTSHLKAHLCSHTGEKPYVCTFTNCGRKFARSDELLRHTRTHTGEKRFHCQHCGKSFGRRDHYEKHCTTHSRAIPKMGTCGWQGQVVLHQTLMGTGGT